MHICCNVTVTISYVSTVDVYINGVIHCVRSYMSIPYHHTSPKWIPTEISSNKQALIYFSSMTKSIRIRFVSDQSKTLFIGWSVVFGCGLC